MPFAQPPDQPPQRNHPHDGGEQRDRDRVQRQFGPAKYCHQPHCAEDGNQGNPGEAPARFDDSGQGCQSGDQQRHATEQGYLVRRPEERNSPVLDSRRDSIDHGPAHSCHRGKGRTHESGSELPQGKARPDGRDSGRCSPAARVPGRTSRPGDSRHLGAPAGARGGRRRRWLTVRGRVHPSIIGFVPPDSAGWTTVRTTERAAERRQRNPDRTGVLPASGWRSLIL
ncbi:hypothetical protein BJQ89_01277 [Arthrobacter sp. ES1]|nr:hypothetical protein [Arthrobacter sp. ES1]